MNRLAKRKLPSRRNRNGGDLHKGFLTQLAEVYQSELKIRKGLTKLIKAAKSEKLRKTLEEHRRETDEQISHLKKVFAALDAKRKA